MKKSHIYSPLGDYAEPFSSEHHWKIALKHVSFITLLVVGFVASGLFVLSFIETYVEFMYK